MSHDFAKKQAAKKKKFPKQAKKVSGKSSSPIPGWLLFVLGVTLTLLLQLIYHLVVMEEPQPEKTAAGEEKPAKVEEKPKAVEPVYDFYDDLKKMEVKVPDSKVPAREDEKFTQVLQAGVFRDVKEAERQRAEIIMQNFKASVETYTTSAGEVRHKVVVGPFASRSDMNKARSILMNNGVATMVLKR